jgi:CHAT domain-containing protein
MLQMSDGSILSFRKLKNIDIELQSLKDLEKRVGVERLGVRVVNLSEPCNAGDSAGCLERILKEEKFDIVHFAGHSISNTIGTLAKTLLVLPGAEKGKASKMRIEDFAELAGLAEACLVYLSSCEGSSARSVLSLVQHGVPHALGFRCDVEDDKAAKFARDFYESLFTGVSMCTAFRNACSAARRALEDEDRSPIWASPILVAQTDDWAKRTAQEPDRESHPSMA